MKYSVGDLWYEIFSVAPKIVENSCLSTQPLVWERWDRKVAALNNFASVTSKRTTDYSQNGHFHNFRRKTNIFRSFFRILGFNWLWQGLMLTCTAISFLRLSTLTSVTSWPPTVMCPAAGSMNLYSSLMIVDLPEPEPDDMILCGGDTMAM